MFSTILPYVVAAIIALIVGHILGAKNVLGFSKSKDPVDVACAKMRKRQKEIVKERIAAVKADAEKDAIAMFTASLPSVPPTQTGGK